MKPRLRSLALAACLAWFGTAMAAGPGVVINEIMYHPPNDRKSLQYVELHNPGDADADLSGWAFTKGIDYKFPQGVRIPAGGYLVVCRDRARFAAQYGGKIPTAGDFTGKLSHHGERIELSDASGKAVDTVKYGSDGAWPVGPDGTSSSLERIVPAASGDAPGNWAGSKLPQFEAPSGTPGRRNDNYSAKPLPGITGVAFKVPAPGEPAVVTADIAGPGEIQQAVLLYRTAFPGRETAEASVAMARVSGDARAGSYKAVVPGQPAGTLVRFRVKAVDGAGAIRLEPRPTEPQPAFSYYINGVANTATVPLGYIINVTPSREPPRQPGRFSRFGGNAEAPRTPCVPNTAFVYIAPGTAEARTYDFVHVPRRSGGYKIHFPKGRPLDGMSIVNVIFEDSPRWILSEPLSYEVYRMAGMAAEKTDHLRLTVDGQLLGYHLMVEQPNRSFLARNGRDTSGSMYKYVWYGNDLVSKHEKKTNLEEGHDDLVEVLTGLQKKSGAELSSYIRTNFDVPEFANYYAVNMCIQNWDGFFNNFFAYHDTGGTGKWVIYPWDEDKTWGDYDGASPAYDWYEMPLTYGMKGERPPRVDPGSKANNIPGPFGGVSWWRAGGYFSGPLLADPEFRGVFLKRLRELCDTVFTEEKLYPLIDAMEKRLEPEIAVRARAVGEDPGQALQGFHRDMQSFRNQVKFRRKFLLGELAKAR